MIDLSAYPKFQQDIQGKQTGIYPIVVIYGDPNIYISTVKETLNVLRPPQEGWSSTYVDVPTNFKDYGLQISNIKESIDIVNKKFKISNVSLKLSNYLTDNQRISDVISKYINKDVAIFYKSQGCTALEDCLPVYSGKLKDASYTDATISIILEDLTDTKMHKDIPVANLGFSNNIYSEKYLNKYIPICYGKVDKAPAVLYKDSDSPESLINVISDNVFGVNNQSVEISGYFPSTSNPHHNAMIPDEDISPFYIYKDNYFNVRKDARTTDIYYGFNQKDQFSLAEDYQSLRIEKKFILDEPQNPPAENVLEAVRVAFPSEAKLMTSGEDDIFDSSNQQVFLVDETVKSLESAIDSPYITNDFIINTHDEDYLSTFAQIPNNDAIEEYDVLIGKKYIVNEFVPNRSQTEVEHEFLYYSQERRDYAGDQEYNAKMVYAWEIMAWCFTNAHSLGTISEGVNDAWSEYIGTSRAKFIQMPSAGACIIRANEWLNANGLLPIKKSGRNHYFYASTDSTDLRSLWQTKNNQQLDSSNNFNVFTEFSDNNMGRNCLVNSEFPSYVYRCTGDGINYANNVFIGQKSSISREAGAWLDQEYDYAPNPYRKFFNIFPDGTDTPYLFEIDECAVFSPIEVHSANANIGGNRNGARTDYRCYWNGTAIGAIHNYPWISGNASSWIKDDIEGWRGYTGSNDPPSGYKIHSSVYPHIEQVYQNQLCCVDGTLAGGSWALYFPEGATGLMDTTIYDGDQYPYRPRDPNCNTVILPGTFFPLGHEVKYMDSSSSGFHPVGYNCFKTGASFVTSPYSVTLGAGDASNSPDKLIVSLPMSNLDASDAIDTRTYAFGKIGCRFNIEGSSGNTTANNTFKVHLSAANETSGSIDFDGNDDSFRATIMSLQGGDNTLNGQESFVYWDSLTGTAPENAENVFSWTDSGNSAYCISDWNVPDDFNSLLLSYSFLKTDNLNRQVAFETEIYSVGIMQFIAFANALDSNIYLDTHGRVNKSTDILIIDVLGELEDTVEYKYTTIPFDVLNPVSTLLESPADIMYHFVEEELKTGNIMDRDNWKEERSNDLGITFGFSIKEKMDSKELLEELSKNCNLIPKIRGNNNFSFTSIKDNYDDVEPYYIKASDIISFNLGHTPIKDIYTLVNVKYAYDYEEEEFKKQTGYCDGYDFFGNGDGEGNVFIGDQSYSQIEGKEDGYKYGYYGLEREDNVLEFESKYIRNLGSAKILRDYIYMLNCNRHTIAKASLPLKYSNLEVGDIISFDKIINNLTSFGEDYTIENVRNGQIIYPYFMVTSTNKSPKEIKIEATQLHKLESTFSAGLGSLTRLSSEGMTGDDVNVHDFNILLEYLNKDYKYMTSNQKTNADVNLSGIINEKDLNLLNTYIDEIPDIEDEDIYLEDSGTGEDNLLLGDLNGDGVVNVIDLVLFASYILGQYEFTEEQIEVADVNEDENINVVDMVRIANSILGEE